MLSVRRCCLRCWGPAWFTSRGVDCCACIGLPHRHSRRLERPALVCVHLTTRWCSRPICACHGVAAVEC
eukprot:scaffold422700_cov19-Prasinocladus_malaysianus.AAC.1